MSFISFNFIAFIAVLLILYYLLPKKLQQPLLLVFSFFFIFKYSSFLTVYLVITILSTYFAGLNAGKRGVAAACIAFNILLLVVLKYTGWLSLKGLLLPLGISFYTLQAAGYLIDVKREEYPPEKNLLRLALFLSFFPQLVQGPFNRYERMAETLYRPHAYDSGAVAAGLKRALWGYFKKLIVADRIAAATALLFSKPDNYGGFYVLLGIILYAVQLYSDFTGGIDIALGISKALGITMAENFDRPFLAQSVKEYWRRWHISLGAWFRDYLFYSLSASRPMRALAKSLKQRIGKKAGALTSYIATLTVWLCTGLWHGFSLNYIVWGLLFGVIMVLSEELNPLYKKFHAAVKIEKKMFWQGFRVVRTFVILGFVRTFECYEGVGRTLSMLKSIIRVNNWNLLLTDGLGLSSADWLAAAAGVAVMLISGCIPKEKRLTERNTLVSGTLTAAAVLIILVFGAYGMGYKASDFIYGRF
jgi:D-alanyl-lipoteichoic acid acyltransferase DltB (MBOAT superfamily)